MAAIASTVFRIDDNQGEPAMRSVTLSVSSACIAAIAATLSMAPASIAGAQAIEEIIVTARKREESLQDVPIISSCSHALAKLLHDRMTATKL